jgi:hypothetical protein
MERPRLFMITALLLLVCGRPLAGDCARIIHDIRPGAGVSAVRTLSDYLPTLAGSPGDTPVYILEGKEPGATVFVAGGTHGNEIAGIVAATILVERAVLQRGRLIVIPHANHSAAGYPDPRKPGPSSIFIETPGGKREFLYGARRTHPDHQGERDPRKYRYPGAPEELEGAEARNLNRAYPGRPDGNLTQRIAFAIVQLLKEESVGVAFDLHESAPDSRLAWMVVANPKNVGLGALAAVQLEELGIPIKISTSSTKLRGVSHLEWGRVTKARAFLVETPNPRMAEKARGADPVNDPNLPLTRRVGVQLSVFLAILQAFNGDAPVERGVRLRDVPGLLEIQASGIGAFLR